MKRPSSKELSKCVAFTLTELIVAIAIVAIVAVVIFSVTGKISSHAKKAESINNLRNMGGALMAFAMDNNGKLIEGARLPLYKGGRQPFWFNALDAYMGGIDYTVEGRARAERPAWQNCPRKVFKNPISFQGYGCGVGYGWNYANFGYEANQPTKFGWGSRLLEVEKPSHTIIIGTSVDDPEFSDVLKHCMLYAHLTLSAKRFNGKGLYLLLDGRVEAYSPEELVADNQYLFKKQKP